MKEKEHPSRVVIDSFQLELGFLEFVIEVERELNPWRISDSSLRFDVVVVVVVVVAVVVVVESTSDFYSLDPWIPVVVVHLPSPAKQSADRNTKGIQDPAVVLLPMEYTEPYYYPSQLPINEGIEIEIEVGFDKPE